MGKSSKKENFSIGSTLRDRGRKPNTDIGDIWASQKKIAGKRNSPDISNFISSLKGLYNKLPKRLSRIKLPIKLGFRNKSTIVVIVVAIVGLAVFSGAFSSSVDKNTESSDQLGASSDVQQDIASEDVSVVNSTEFDLLWPANTQPEDTEVVIVSPPSNEPVYAYLSTFNGVELRISQQQVPSDFKENVPGRVEEVAKSFQANDIIEVDGNKVYYGFSDEYGGVQSLILEKNGLLIFIASPVKFLDIEWAGFVSGLE